MMHSHNFKAAKDADLWWVLILVVMDDALARLL